MRNQKEINRKISEALKKPKIIKICQQCISKYETNRKGRKFCSRSCSVAWRNENTGLASKAGIASANKQLNRSKNEIMFAELCSLHFPEVICNEPIGGAGF